MGVSTDCQFCAKYQNSACLPEAKSTPEFFGCVNYKEADLAHEQECWFCGYAKDREGEYKKECSLEGHLLTEFINSGDFECIWWRPIPSQFSKES